ncbi:MAG: hypothetical protein KDA76_00590 [Planctomycetaceae bacterium]|nr:hypothetical protein [Planctomycetaceae bacterium]
MAVGRQQGIDQTGDQSVEQAGCLPLQARSDLKTVPIGFGGRLSYVVKDPLALNYHRLQPVQHHLLELMREPRCLPELQLALNEYEPSCQFEVRDVQRMLADFHEKGLLISKRPGQGTQLYLLRQKQMRQKVLQGLQSFLFLKVPGWSPETALRMLDPLRRLMLHPISVGMMLCLIVAALLLVAREHAEFQSRLPAFQQFFSWRNMPYLWLSIIVAKVVHEFGHAFVCRHFGAEPQQIGVMIMVFTPTLYCDVTDSWLLKNKWQRMAIGLGGPLFEASLASLALFVWWWTEPGTLHYVCLNLFLMSTVTNTIFNLNPLVKYDGYYILSDYLEIPNLKQQSDRAMQVAFCRYGLGVDLPRDPLSPESGNPWLLTYGIAAWCYRWLIMFGITLFMYTMLKPVGMQRFAFLLLAVTLGMMGYAMFRGMKQAMQQIQPVKPAPIRYVILGSLGVAVVAAVLLIPIPYWITCQFELEPSNVLHLYSLTPGRLREVCVQPGDQVSAGDVLLRLHNPDLEDELGKERMQLEIQEKRLLVARLKRDDEQIAAASDQMASIEARLENLLEQEKRLTIVAPISGRVYPPQRKPGQLAEVRERLPQWSGSLFDASNRNAWVEKGMPVLSLAPEDRMQAVLLIDQNTRNDLAVGQPVLLQCHSWVGRYWSSEIREIGERDTDQPPAALAGNGSGVTVVTDARGRQKMVSAAYRGIVPLSEKAEIEPLLGTTGKARVIISHRTTAGWAWRLACQTFQFRL